MFIWWISEGHRVLWTHQTSKGIKGDFCFLLSCGQIIPESILNNFRHTLVVHESALPHGKGWSPLTWQILEGKNTIPVTLFEADRKVDNGDIYLQDLLCFSGTELVSELRKAQADITIKMCQKFVNEYPDIIALKKKQHGTATFYPRRIPADSMMDINKTLKNQFNLLRVADNDKYPVFFELNECKYLLKIEKDIGIV